MKGACHRQAPFLFHGVGPERGGGELQPFAVKRAGSRLWLHMLSPCRHAASSGRRAGLSISLRRYWQQFARVLAAERQKQGGRNPAFFSLFRLSFGVWKYRHAQALDPVRFQEADIAELSQLVQLCPVQIGPQVCSTLAALEVGRYQQFMVDLAVQLVKRALVESQVEE